MLRRLSSIVSNILQSKGEAAAQAEMLNSLSAGDGMDEPTAYAILLMSLATADGEVASGEHEVIVDALKRLFPREESNIPDIISTATGYLSSFRDYSSFIGKIKEEYSPDERKTLYSLLDKIVVADGNIDGVESYLRGKFRSLLA